MSTRCNLKITSDDSQQLALWLYRHHDGYLSETGQDIIRTLIKWYDMRRWDFDFRETPAQLAQTFLSESYEPTEYCDARPIYEMTDAIHGDIEYVYRIHLTSTGEIQVGYAKRGDAALNDAPTTLMTLESFAEAVNRDIDESNLRIQELKRKCPTEYQHCEEEPKIDISALAPNLH